MVSKRINVKFLYHYSFNKKLCFISRKYEKNERKNERKEELFGEVNRTDALTHLFKERSCPYFGQHKTQSSLNRDKISEKDCISVKGKDETEKGEY